MKNVTNDFINLSKKVRKQDMKLSINNQDLSNKPRELIYSFDGELFRTIMQQIEFSIKNVREVKDKFVNFKYGILINNSYEYVDMGDFFIKDLEDDKRKDDLRLTGYDKMINFMKQFKQSELQLTYPCTMGSLVTRMCEVCGVEIYSANFFNSNLIIDTDFYTIQEITYRDVLEKVAQATMTTIFIKQNRLYLCKIGDSVQILDTSFLSNIVVKEKFGPVNALVLGRGSVEDNIEAINQESIDENRRCEIRFDENEFVDGKRNDVIDSMFSQIDGLEYYAIESKNLGLMWLDPCDVITERDRENNEYKTICLKMRVVINTGAKGEIKADIPEATTTKYKVTSKEEKKTLRVERIAKKNEGVIEDVIEETAQQNNKISRVEQTVSELNSKISDIADITTSQETLTGLLNFENINQSEPIHIEIRPISESISYLYPSENLYPADNLYLKFRTLRFTNTTSNEVFEYELPNDLLYYDSENYDELILDYDSQKVYVNKKCKYNSTTGVVELLTQETILEYDFPEINLTDGNYIIEMLKYKYNNTRYPCYLFIRLMAQNIYTTQFAIKSEVNTKISQLSTSINLSVDQKLSNYSATIQMNSAIELKINEISSIVSETYATKLQMNSAINQKANEINVEVNKKVNSTDFTHAKIVAKINDNTSSVLIDADKIDLSANKVLNLLAGNEINLTTKNISIKSSNFSVDRNGGEIVGFKLENTRFSKNISGIYNYNVYDFLSCRNYLMNNLDGNYYMDNSYRNILDYNNDNEIDLIDLMLIKRVLIGTETNRKNVSGTFQINTDDPKNCIVIKNGAELAVSIGIGGVNATNVTAETLYVGHLTGMSESSEAFKGVFIDGLSGSVYADGNIESKGTITQTSLQRNKKNFEEFRNALDIIKNIDIYKYNMKDEDETNKKHIGFVIGDDFNYSEEVTSNKNDGVDLYSFVSLCCKAIQEQQEEIEMLKAI